MEHIIVPLKFKNLKFISFSKIESDMMLATKFLERK